MKHLLFIILFFGITNFSFSQKTAYGYVKRDPTSYVNYAEISNNLNKSLQNSRAIYLDRLKEAGWSSEQEYLEYKRIMRKQNKLKRKFDHGSKNVSVKYDNNGHVVYYETNTISSPSVKHNQNIPCNSFVYKAVLVKTLPQYMYLFSEKANYATDKRLIKLSENAVVNVITEFSNDNSYVYVCYNGVSGFISKNLLIKQ